VVGDELPLTKTANTATTTNASAATATHRTRSRERLLGDTAVKLPRGWGPDRRRAPRSRAQARVSATAGTICSSGSMTPSCLIVLTVPPCTWPMNMFIRTWC